jgi:RND family efflux transporter MFP subunit
MENEEIKKVEKDNAKGLKKALLKLKKTKRKTKIIIGIILVVVLLIVGFAILRKKEVPYEWTEVMRGDVIEEVSATGVVESATEVDLRFKSGGIVERINVNVGDEVKKGTYLIQLASGELQSQFLQAQASYTQAKAKLDQLLAGATDEEVRVAEQVLENARVALEDAKAEADNDLQQDYNSALVGLVDASSKCNKALADLKDMERNYFYRSTNLENVFRDKRGVAENAFWGISSLGIKGAEQLVDEALEDPTHENIDLVLIEMKSAAQKVIDALDYTKKAMADSSVREDVSSTDRTTIDTDITNVNAAYSNVNDAQTDIANQKITNQTDINNAESTYKKAQADLEELKAPPREVDIAVYQADVEKYRANMNEFNQKIRDASIIAPFDGTVAKIDVKIGEVITAGGKVVASLISPGSFQIRADISEADISKVDLEDPTKVTLDAFPEETWPGQIIEIEPGETLIEGVVYYRVKILFEGGAEKVKSGMTADVVIETSKEENVLYVPQRSVFFKDNAKFVRVLEGEEVKEVKVETGLKGEKGEIEIISGLNEGQEVITFMRK